LPARHPASIVGGAEETRATAMISKPAQVYDDAMHAVWQDVRVVALLAVVAFLLVILPT
jgi:hypothetical protein